MTLYLLIMNDDGDESYSLWKTESSAKSEMRYLKEQTGLSIYAFDIVAVAVND